MVVQLFNNGNDDEVKHAFIAKAHLGPVGCVEYYNVSDDFLTG